MICRRSFRSLLGAGVLAIGILGGPLNMQANITRADGVGDAQQKVNQILDELDSLRNQMGQIDEDHAAALDRQDQLVIEIATSQARVDDLMLQLGNVESVLQQIAVSRFTGGDSLSLSPIFSDAATYNEAEQRSALGLVAIDTGEGSIDGLQLLVDDLASERAVLERKQAEAAGLIATLEQKQKDYNQLEQVYLAKEAAAQADLGKEQLAAAEEARAASAAVAAAAQAAKNAAANRAPAGNTGGATPPAPRGGGSDPVSAGSGTGGDLPGNGGGDAGAGASTAPPVSGKAGIAVSAAYSQLGVPYRFAAEAPNEAFDCSGLTKFAWGRAGVGLPHQSSAQFGSLPHVAKGEAQPGDLVFYYAPIGHVGIYIGGGQMIHAPQTGDVVKISTVNWGKVVGVARPG
jgi:cell wall-associated NlpC family hydrolase